MKKFFLISLLSTFTLLANKHEVLSEAGKIIEGNGKVTFLSYVGLASGYVGFNALLEHEAMKKNGNANFLMANKTAWISARQMYVHSPLSRKSFMITGPVLYLLGRNMKERG